MRFAAALFILCFALAGCGFHPLYGTHASESSSRVVDALSKIAIRPLPDREGMKLRQVLREQLQPRGAADVALYDLDVALSTRIEELGIRRDATSSRANLIMVAEFYLNESGQRVFGDRVQTVVAYNILDDQYATVAAQADAESRAIQQVGESIKTRLAVYFERGAHPMASATP